MVLTAARTMWATGPGVCDMKGGLLVALYVGAIGAPPAALRAAFLLVGWAAARALGMSRVGLYKKMKRHGMIVSREEIIADAG